MEAEKSSADKAATSSPSIPIPNEVHALAEQIGGFIQFWGFKAIHGRIWTHLFLSDQPLDAGALVRRLGVSKALISMSMKELLKHQVVKAQGKSAGNTQLYGVNPDVMGIILRVLQTRESRMLTAISKSFDNVNALSVEDKSRSRLSPDRIAVLSELIETGRQTLEGLTWGRSQTSTPASDC